MDMQVSYAELGVESSAFVGYGLTEQDSTIGAILSGGLSVGHALQGQKVEVIISRSPFYAEGGGQLGDQGSINGPNGVIEVEDTQSRVAGLIVHRGTVKNGEISVGDSVTAVVALDRRLDSSRNQAAKTGADGYLTKPIRESELLETIKSVSKSAFRRSHRDKSQDQGAIRFNCTCGKRFKVSIKRQGKLMTCSSCGNPLTVPRQS